MSDRAHDVGGSGAAHRRGDRRCHMHWSHEQLSLRMLLASVGHHSWQSVASVGVQIVPAPPTEYVALVPVPERTTPVLAVHAAPARTYECFAPAPVITDLASLLKPPVPDVSVAQVVQVPQLQIIEKFVEIP